MSFASARAFSIGAFRARAVIESGASQHGDFHRIHFGVQRPVPEYLFLQQNLSLELSAPIAVTPAEATDLGLVQLGDDLTHGSVLNRNSGQHLVGRCAVVMTAFVDEQEPGHAGSLRPSAVRMLRCSTRLEDDHPNIGKCSQRPFDAPSDFVPRETAEAWGRTPTLRD